MTRSRKRKLAGRAKMGRHAAGIRHSGRTSVAMRAAAEHGKTTRLEEVVVTAQKRSEDLQKVPISLQVLGTEKLEQLQVTISMITPSCCRA